MYGFKHQCLGWNVGQFNLDNDKSHNVSRCAQAYSDISSALYKTAYLTQRLFDIAFWVWHFSQKNSSLFHGKDSAENGGWVVSLPETTDKHAAADVRLFPHHTIASICKPHSHSRDPTATRAANWCSRGRAQYGHDISTFRYGVW